MGNTQTSRYKKRHDNDQHKSDRTYTQLINMGFEASLSLIAAQKFPNNIHNAIDWISKHSMNNENETLNPSEQKCSGGDCAAIQRVIKILNFYNEWLYNEKNKTKNSVNKYLNTSTCKDILTNYQHLKYKGHNLSSHNITCVYSAKCIPLKRHKRDNNKNYAQQYFGGNVKEIVTQKFLDQIHLFIYHPLTENDKMSNNQRFGTNIASENLNDEKKESNLKQGVYNFGQQFFYWNYSKAHKWFVRQRYSDLKDELLHNDIYKIDGFDWILEYENALDKLNNDETVKSLKSNSEFEDKYGIQVNIVIPINHLLSILFYCNTNVLQNRFSATYRRSIINNINESDDELKKRHSYYYHFGKLLRETVEAFGQLTVDDDLPLYYGIDHPLYFSKMVAKFHGPTSTSLSIIIAAQFAGTNGLILKMGKYIRNAFYFDCSMSGFDREQEHLFIGGYASLKIQTILNLSGDDFANYDRYLSLMECFFGICRNVHVDESVTSSLDSNDNILQSIIENQTDQKNGNTSDIPIYILNLFRFRCNRLKQINIYLDEFIKISNVLHICKYSLNGDRSMINFNFLIYLFPNTEKIRVTVTSKFNFTQQFIKYLSLNLLQNSIRSSSCFQSIEFCFGMKLLSREIEDQIYLTSISTMRKIGWKVRIGSNEEDTTSVYFVNSGHQPNDVIQVQKEAHKEKVFDNRIKTYSSHLKDESIMKCIGTLEYDFGYKKCRTGTVFSGDWIDRRMKKFCTGTVFSGKPESNKTFVISNADGCFLDGCLPMRMYFQRRCIQRGRFDEGYVVRFGEIIQMYEVQIEYMPVYNPLHWSGQFDGLDLVIFSFEDKDSYYRNHTKNIEIAEGLSTLTQYNKFTVYGFSPQRDRRFRHSSTIFELSGTSTLTNDFAIVESGQQFILKQNEAFTAAGQGGSAVWVKNENTGKTLIFAVHSAPPIIGRTNHQGFAGIATFLRCEDLIRIKSLIEVNEDHQLSWRCICGTTMLPRLSKNCYENDSVSVGCSRCMRDFSNGQIVYHCWKGRQVPQHEDGYDLCVKCVTEVIQNEKLDRMGDLWEDIVVKIASFSVNQYLRSMMGLKLINKHWYESLNPCKPEVNEIWERNMCRALFLYIPKNLKIKRWDRYYLYKYYSLTQQRNDYSRLSNVDIGTGSAYRTFEMVENCAYISDQLNGIKDDECNQIGTHGLPKGYKLKAKCPVSALKMKMVGTDKYSCNVCQKNVYLANTEQQMLEVVSKGQCVQYSMDDQEKVIKEIFKKATLRDRRQPVDESPFKNEPIIDCIGILLVQYKNKTSYGTGTIVACNNGKAFVISNAGTCIIRSSTPTSIYFIIDQRGKTKKYETKLEYFNDKYLSISDSNKACAGFDYAVLSFKDTEQFYAQLTKDIIIYDGVKALEQYGRFSIYEYKRSCDEEKLLRSELWGDSAVGRNYWIVKHKRTGKHYLRQKEVVASVGGSPLWAKDEMTGSIVVFGIHTGYSNKLGCKIAHLLSDEDLQNIFNCIQ